jgi:hypothetical protein
MDENINWLTISYGADFNFCSLFSGVPKLMEFTDKVLLLESIDFWSKIQLNIDSSASEHISNRVDKGSSNIGTIWNISIHGFELLSDSNKFSTV